MSELWGALVAFVLLNALWCVTYWKQHRQFITAMGNTIKAHAEREADLATAYQQEAAMWRAERRELLDRIQAPSLAEFKALTKPERKPAPETRNPDLVQI